LARSHAKFLGSGSETTLRSFASSNAQSIALERLLRDSLAFSKPRPLEASAVGVSELIGAVADLIRPEAEVAQVRFAVEDMRDIPPVR
jgi:hypothetical protein